jgi:hypothetical protein
MKTYQGVDATDSTKRCVTLIAEDDADNQLIHGIGEIFNGIQELSTYEAQRRAEALAEKDGE